MLKPGNLSSNFNPNALGLFHLEAERSLQMLSSHSAWHSASWPPLVLNLDTHVA